MYSIGSMGLFSETSDKQSIRHLPTCCFKYSESILQTKLSNMKYNTHLHTMLLQKSKHNTLFMFIYTRVEGLFFIIMR